METHFAEHKSSKSGKQLVKNYLKTFENYLKRNGCFRITSCSLSGIDTVVVEICIGICWRIQKYTRFTASFLTTEKSLQSAKNAWKIRILNLWTDPTTNLSPPLVFRPNRLYWSRTTALNTTRVQPNKKIYLFSVTFQSNIALNVINYNYRIQIINHSY